MSGPGPLTRPVVGVPIATDGACTYRQRRSAERQARYWAAALADDPDFKGFTVTIGPEADGRYPLVWTRAPYSQEDIDAIFATGRTGETAVKFDDGWIYYSSERW